MFDFDEINKFNLVLVFETVEVDEISADFIKQYRIDTRTNPKKAEAKKEKNDACREKRKEEGTTKTFS